MKVRVNEDIIFSFRWTMVSSLRVSCFPCTLSPGYTAVVQEYILEMHYKSVHICACTQLYVLINKCTCIKKRGTYILKENIICMYVGACICVHARLQGTRTEGCVEFNIQSWEGSDEYERGISMFVLLCRAQKERMYNISLSHTHSQGHIHSRLSGTIPAWMYQSHPSAAQA